MAKRIQVKGKAPRGFSKAQRIILDESKKLAANPFTLARDLNKNWSNTRQRMESAGRDVSSRPSSTRKKRVKEGNRKFIGPRQLQGELAEIETRASRDRSSPHRDRSRERTAAERREDREHNRYLLREMRKKSDPFTEGLSPKVRKRLLDFVNSKMKSAGIPGSGSKYQEDLIRAVDASGWFAGIYDKPRSKR